jgi:hypothetical protein
MTFKLATTALFLAMLTSTLTAVEHSQVIRTNRGEYQVRVNGTRSPVNEAIVIENVGRKDIVNPRISINDRYDWFDAQSIVAEAVRGCETDEEKAMAVWRFIGDNCHYGGLSIDATVLNTVRFLNTSAGQNCGVWAPAVVSLAEAAGLKARVWEIGHHTVPEVYFDGKWHLLDARIGGNFGLLRDNKTIASMADLESDPYYLERCLFRNPDPEPHKVAMYYITTSDNYVETGYEKMRLTPRTMAITLRPGEKLVRYFREGGKYYGGPEGRRWDHFGGGKEHPLWYGRQCDSYDEPQAYSWGQIVLKPDFDRYPLSRYTRSVSNAAAKAEDGREPAIHVDIPRSMKYSMPSRVRIGIETPWPVIGGTIKGKAYAWGSSNIEKDKAAVSVSVGRRGGGWRMGDEGEKEFEINFDKAINYGLGGIYNLSAGFSFYCPPDEIPYEKDYQPPSHDRPVQAGIDEFTLTADIQVAPKSVPALSLGGNRVVYTDETAGAHDVKITHVWNERSDNNPPPAPRKAKSPTGKGRVKSLTPVLAWEDSRDKDRADSIAEYHVFLSLNPKCIWPLSPNFDILTGSADPSFSVAEGWLNPGTTYYWRVRARDSRDLWGPWSPVWKFTTDSSLKSFEHPITQLDY